LDFLLTLLGLSCFDTNASIPSFVLKRSYCYYFAPTVGGLSKDGQEVRPSKTPSIPIRRSCGQTRACCSTLHYVSD
jgi:hypothetical protein